MKSVDLIGIIWERERERERERFSEFDIHKKMKLHVFISV